MTESIILILTLFVILAVALRRSSSDKRERRYQAPEPQQDPEQLHGLLSAILSELKHTNRMLSAHTERMRSAEAPPAPAPRPAAHAAPTPRPAPIPPAPPAPPAATVVPPAPPAQVNPPVAAMPPAIVPEPETTPPPPQEIPKVLREATPLHPLTEPPVAPPNPPVTETPETPNPPVVPVPEPKPVPAPKPEPRERIPEPEPVAEPAAAEPAPPYPSEAPDLERFIGQKLISFIGIGILVLGIFFAVKWAISNDLINDAGKILIGLLSGTALIGTAHRIRKSYHAFSSILVGGGLAVLYFSVYIGFQDYHLLGQTPVFAAMIFITVCAVLLSVFYDRKELAVIAIIGGFATPFFVSRGEGNFQALFAYLLVLNAGMFALAVYKRWNLVNLISYGATVLIFTAWTVTKFNDTAEQARPGFLFATLFYLIFLGMNIVYNLRNKARFRALEISLLISNTFLYFGAGMFFLTYIQQQRFQGVFTIALAALNFVLAYRFYKKEADRNLVYLMIGLVLTFVSLAGPVQLQGNNITLFWATELVLLYWLGKKSGIMLIRNASLPVMALAIVSLLLDWNNYYFSPGASFAPVVNKIFFTGAALCAALAIVARMMRTDPALQAPDSTWRTTARRLVPGMSVLVGYFAMLLELNYQADRLVGVPSFTHLCIWIYHYAVLLVLFAIEMRMRKHGALVSALAVGALCFLFPFANGEAVTLRDLYLRGNEVGGGLFAVHFLLPVLALANVAMLIRYARSRSDGELRFFGGAKGAAWFLTAAALMILSSETVQIWVTAGYRLPADILPLRIRAVKIALPILWSVSSLVLMLLGMRMRRKTLRLISLTLFSLTILKLFTYDISGVSQGGKIAAFIVLGVILLVVSFLYQKIKGLFADDEPEDASHA